MKRTFSLIALLAAVLFAIPAFAANFHDGAGTVPLRARIQSLRHITSGSTPVYLEFLTDNSGVFVCTYAAGTTVPTANPYDNVYWAVGAKFIDIDATSATAVIYYNTGTRAVPVWTATDTALTEADILALIGDLDHAHTSSAVSSGTFTGTAATADTLLATHDASAATNGTLVYVGAYRGETGPAILVSENANSATAYVNTVTGALPIPVIHQATEDSDIVVGDDDTAATLGGQLRLIPISGPNRWGAVECKLVAEMTSRTGIAYTVSTPSDTAAIEHSSFLKSVEIPLHNFRLLSTNDIQNLAAHGGIGAKDSTPILETVNPGTDNSLRLNFATGVTTAIAQHFQLPPDIDGTQAVRLKIHTQKSANNDTVAISVKTYWDNGALVTDSTGTIAQSATTYAVEIAASDVPDSAARVGIELVPGAHAGDAIYVHGVSLEYYAVSDDILVFCDEDAANTDERFLQSNLWGKTCYVRLASGRLWQFAYSATASSTGVAVYVDDDAGGTSSEELVFVSPTDTNGAAVTGSRDGMFAIDGLWTGAAYVNNTSNEIEYLSAASIDVPVWTISGNREVKANHDAAPADDLLYFDDDAVDPAARFLINATDTTNHSIALETTERPFWVTPAGTLSITTTPTVNTSGALIP